MSDKIRVLLVEDQAMPRQLFELLIRGSDKYELVTSLESAATADIYCLRRRIDLVLMDVITKNGANGLEAAARIKRQTPGIKIIIVTSMPEYSYIKRAREIGVESFWYKDLSTQPILSLMDATMAGESIYPDRTPELRLGNASSYEFTEKELEVLRYLTGGGTNEEIASCLHISVNSVKNYLKSMQEKTGFRNRTELAVRAREAGLVILSREETE